MLSLSGEKPRLENFLMHLCPTAEKAECGSGRDGFRGTKMHCELRSLHLLCYSINSTAFKTISLGLTDHIQTVSLFRVTHICKQLFFKK
jgi:hypothetical protein